MDSLRTVMPGDPFRPSASRENAWTAAAKWVRDRQVSIGSSRKEHLEPGMILVRNDSGADRGPYSVLGISDELVLVPSQTKSEFGNRFLLSGKTPAAEHEERFVILVDGIPSGKIGRAWAYGFAYVRVNVTNAEHGYAGATSGDCEKLTSRSDGLARILAKESGTGTKWAIVRFGGEGGVGSAPFLARVKPGTHYNNVCKVQPLQAGQHESAPTPAIDDSPAAEITGVVLRSSANLSGKYVWVIRLSAGKHMAVLADPIDAFYGCQ